MPNPRIWWSYIIRPDEIRSQIMKICLFKHNFERERERKWPVYEKRGGVKKGWRLGN